jgi:3-keto-disaccharide hydrolase
MKKFAIVFCAVILLAACVWTAAGQSAPVPGKDGWISMFDGKTLNGWKANGNPGSWKAVDGAIVGDGPASHLFWMERECENCEFRAEVKLNHSGNSGMYFRTAFGPGFPKGYEAQVENTSPDPQKTGSLYGICKVTDQLIQDDTWWTQDITVKGNHVVIKVNGKTVTDCDDPQSRYTKGYLALQQHNAGSIVMFRNLMMRPLP